VTLGDHYDQCVETQTPSRGGVRPFAGATLSPADLATFTGEEACGVWTLRLHDGAEYDEGALLDWTLDFRNAPVSNDCNNNVIPDECELAAGTADDADGNGIPDECFMLRDCNSNGINDEVELELSVTGDCNDNRILDVCELNGLGGLAVAGIGSDIVAEFDPDTGRYLGELVSNDDPCAVYLDLPTNLVFAPDGDLLVCDIADSRVLAFDGLSGAFHGEFVAEDAGGLISPIDLDFAPDGSLLVLDLARGVVQRHDGASGAYLGDFATVSAPSQSFRHDLWSQRESVCHRHQHGRCGGVRRDDRSEARRVHVRRESGQPGCGCLRSEWRSVCWRFHHAVDRSLRWHDRLVCRHRGGYVDLWQLVHRPDGFRAAG
jgi:hypothetical protein